MTFKVAGFTHQRRRTFAFNSQFPDGSPGALFMETIREWFQPDGTESIAS